jgi:cathepsin D
VTHPLSGSIHNLRKRDTGAVSLIDDNAQLWHGTISVGTPPVSFTGTLLSHDVQSPLPDSWHDTVDFDTGSSDLFLPSSSCGQSCEGHKIYVPNASSTAQDLGQTFSLAFGDGSSVLGDKYTDVVNIAGLTVCRNAFLLLVPPALTGGTKANMQTLGAASLYSLGLESSRYPADGLMGMAFQSISVYDAPPPFQTLISQGVVTSPVFGFKFAASGSSELFLGGTNSALYTGEFTWVPLLYEVCCDL